MEETTEAAQFDGALNQVFEQFSQLVQEERKTKPALKSFCPQAEPLCQTRQEVLPGPAREASTQTGRKQQENKVAKKDSDAVQPAKK